MAQLSIAAISVDQLVAAWTTAVRDPDSMVAFYVDRLAIPKASTQGLTPAILERARRDQVHFALIPPPGSAVYAGFDTGDRCWFTARARHADGTRSLVWAEMISAERARARVPQLCQLLNVLTFCGDANPLRDLMRDLVIILNGLVDYTPPPDVADSATLMFPGGLTWDGPNARWRGLRAAAVEFTAQGASGTKHKLGCSQDNALYPILGVHRDDTIQNVVNQLLTPTEGVIDATRPDPQQPSYFLPRRPAGAPTALEVYERHLLTGSRRVKSNDGKKEEFIDQVENHYLLSTAYADLAEKVGIQSRDHGPLLMPMAFAAGPRALERETREVIG